jgi:hypothetical protein
VVSEIDPDRLREQEAFLLGRAHACGVPLPIAEALVRYAVHKAPTGGFLNAFLSCDLRETFARADDTNILKLREIFQFVSGYLSATCWGSPEAVAAWLAAPASSQTVFSHG